MLICKLVLLKLVCFMYALFHLEITPDPIRGLPKKFFFRYPEEFEHGEIHFQNGQQLLSYFHIINILMS